MELKIKDSYVEYFPDGQKVGYMLAANIGNGNYMFTQFSSKVMNMTHDLSSENGDKKELILKIQELFDALFDSEKINAVILDVNNHDFEEDYNDGDILIDIETTLSAFVFECLNNKYNVIDDAYESTNGSNMTMLTITRK